MALTWEWSKPCGYAYVDLSEGNGETLTLYQGNALLIFMAECADEYQLVGFFANKDHAKNCLGLSKGYTRWSLKIRSVTLYPTECDWISIAKLLIKAYPDIEVHITPPPNKG